MLIIHIFGTMSLITSDDIIELYSKLHQRGLGFILSKINPSALKRTQSTFNHTAIEAANWWQVPQVRERMNIKATGDKQLNYETYTVNKYLDGKQGLKLLSLGSGVCSHEIKFATHPCFSQVKCVDVSEKPLAIAAKNAQHLGLTNMVFEVANVNENKLEENHYDVVLFHSSLHHFKRVFELIAEQVAPSLKKDGLLVINDYVGPNRLQWTAAQLQETNRLLNEIVPVHFRKRLKTSRVKKHVSGPGIIRMLLSDPSEAVDAESILPAIYKHFNVLEENDIGGNILMLLLKDIAHHFTSGSIEADEVLQRLFNAEDDFLSKEKSNQVFGIYRKKN